MENKKPWKSKTLILNLIVAILAVAYPPAVSFIQANSELVMALFAGLNMILRLVTKDKIGLEA